METFVTVAFVAGYVLITLEHSTKINKTATAIITGVLCWTLYALSPTAEGQVQSDLSRHFTEVSSILFFLLCAMTIVEVIDAHDGFRFIVNAIRTSNVRKLLWIVCWITFVLSAVLDNLTTSIVMVTLTQKLIGERDKRLLFCGMVVVAANAGGAWSPIGDVTTTMLWIGGRVSSMHIMQSLILPSAVCLTVPLLFLTWRLKGNVQPIKSADPSPTEQRVKGGKTILLVGLGTLVTVPVFKAFTHLPPFMGMLLGLGIIWVVSELINPNLDDDERKRLSAAAALSRIDVSSVLFFMGILLAVGALESMHVLHSFSEYISQVLTNEKVLLSAVGAASAIVDNVPLVAAYMSMYTLDQYPTDHMVWEYLAYCVGTGGSLLIIGSAAGVAVMGMEKMTFGWYLKRISLLALLGYVAGSFTYFLTA